MILCFLKKRLKYGIALVSGKEYRFYVIEINDLHSDIQLLYSQKQSLQKKQRKGGQSALRFSRIREEKYNWFIDEVVEDLVTYYSTKNNSENIIEGLVLAGPADVKNNICNHDLFKQYLSFKILKIISTDVIENSTIYKVCEDCFYLFNNTRNDVFDEVKKLIVENPDILVFGNEIKDAIDLYQLKKLVASKDFIFEANGSKCEVILVDNEKMKKFGYGNAIGIKWF